MGVDLARSFVDRLNADPLFTEAVRRDPAGAAREHGLVTAERLARSVDDEDALRRLATHAATEDARVWTWIKRKMSRLFCGPGKTRSWECKNSPG